MQFYISMMFLGLPDDIHEEKPTFFNFENNWLPTDGPTDRRTDRQTDRRTDRQTDQWTDQRTDQWTDGRTDQCTDKPSYRDARMHLKTDSF